MGSAAVTSRSAADVSDRIDWPRLKRQIAKLRFVVSAPVLGFVPGDPSCNAIQLRVDVNRPANGLLYDLRQEETVWIRIPDGYPDDPPVVLIEYQARSTLPHATFMKYGSNGYLELCLTRRSVDDWWSECTLTDVVSQAHNWLCDAAAGELLKGDDPYEPLLLSDALGVIEIDTSKAITTCAERNGVWETKSKDRSFSATDGKRFSVGDGEIPTLVVHQSNIQEEQWNLVPRSISMLKEFLDKVGLPGANVESQLKKWLKREGLSCALLVVGVRRTKEILGQVDENEWLGFCFRRPDHPPEHANKSLQPKDWSIDPYRVHRTFDMPLARAVSGFRLDSPITKAVVLGVGSLGSALLESLARSGLFEFIAIDNDSFLPHNLARHSLVSPDIGWPKSLAIERKINALLFSEGIVKASGYNAARFSDEGIQHIFDSPDVIIDCSASVAVRRRIAELPRPHVPIISLYLIDHGETCVMLYGQGKDQDEQLDVIEAAAIADYKQHAPIARWLSEDVEPVQIGGGCRSTSAKISDATVRWHAAWAARAILDWVSGQQPWPEYSGYGLAQLSPGCLPTYTVQWQPITARRFDSPTGWTVFVRDEVVKTIEGFIKQHPGKETPGVLIGAKDRRRKRIFVMDALDPPPDSKMSASSCERGVSGLRSSLAVIEADTRHRIGYVGEWHSHPPKAGVAMSPKDQTTGVQLASDLMKDRLPAVCLISNGSDFDLTVIEDQR